MQHFGGPAENFRLQAFIDVANEYIRLDETERALHFLDNLPAYYRDHKPMEIVELKNELLKRIATPRLYSTGEFDCQFDLMNERKMHKSLRGNLILKEVSFLNEQSYFPHVVDYGPGEFWLPIILSHFDKKFTYSPIALNKESERLAHTHIGTHIHPKQDGNPTVYVACEIIEHLWHQQELKTEMLHNCGFADVIHISTPRYTFDARDLDWKTNKPDIGHLRAYTPRDFMMTVMDMFPEYDTYFYDSTILHARLILKDSKFKEKLMKREEVVDLNT